MTYSKDLLERWVLYELSILIVAASCGMGCDLELLGWIRVCKVDVIGQCMDCHIVFILFLREVDTFLRLNYVKRQIRVNLIRIEDGTQVQGI